MAAPGRDKLGGFSSAKACVAEAWEEGREMRLEDKQEPGLVRTSWLWKAIQIMFQADKIK